MGDSTTFIEENPFWWDAESEINTSNNVTIKAERKREKSFKFNPSFDYFRGESLNNNLYSFIY
jgi:hypothetical protein